MKVHAIGNRAAMRLTTDAPRWRSRRGSASGQTSVELVLVMPIVLLMISFVLELALAAAAERTARYAACMAARASAVGASPDRVLAGILTGSHFVFRPRVRVSPDGERVVADLEYVLPLYFPVSPLVPRARLVDLPGRALAGSLRGMVFTTSCRATREPTGPSWGDNEV